MPRRPRPWCAWTLPALLLLAAAAGAAEQVWHPNLEAAQEAARKSQKPLLVVTLWKSGV